MTLKEVGQRAVGAAEGLLGAVVDHSSSSGHRVMQQLRESSTQGHYQEAMLAAGLGAPPGATLGSLGGGSAPHTTHGAGSSGGV
jgi:hypothetical protein